MKKYKIAVLDDYQNVALESADWSVLRDRAEITVFRTTSPIQTPQIERLLPLTSFASRERTPLPAMSLSACPISSSLPRPDLETRRSMLAAAGDYGIAVVHTGYRSDPTIEFTLALILAAARHIVTESNSVRIRRLAANSGTDSEERPLAFWDLGGLDHKSRGLGALFE
jgi:phosphoglycerate dehydrogenase-like enzyme